MRHRQHLRGSQQVVAHLAEHHLLKGIPQGRGEGQGQSVFALEVNQGALHGHPLPFLVAGLVGGHLQVQPGQDDQTLAVVVGLVELGHTALRVHQGMQLMLTSLAGVVPGYHGHSALSHPQGRNGACANEHTHSRLPVIHVHLGGRGRTPATVTDQHSQQLAGQCASGNERGGACDQVGQIGAVVKGCPRLAGESTDRKGDGQGAMARCDGTGQAEVDRLQTGGHAERLHLRRSAIQGQG